MTSIRGRIATFFIRQLQMFQTISGPIDDLRRWTDAGSSLLITPLGVTVQKAYSSTIPGEWIVPKSAPPDRTLMYIHGGGFLYCSLKTHRALVARLAKASGIRAFSVDYRLAPEHPFPAAVDDCVEAYRGLLKSGIEPKRIVVAGDSAGGNLALVLLLALRKAGDPLPAAAVCLSPATDLTFTGESFRTKADIDPVFSPSIAQTLIAHIVSDYIGSADPRQPLLSPLFGDWHELPPVLLHVGEDEILLDDSVRMAERIHSAGGQATLVVWKGLWHVFQAYAPFFPEAGQSIRQIGEFISRRQQD